MAVSGKRLFWISMIMVELVLLYVVWRPYRDRFMRPSHRSAIAPPVVRQPETKPTAIVVASRRPFKATRSNLRAPGRAPIVNASLKVPEPIPAVPVSVLVPQVPSSSSEGFWCYIATIGLNCDCKVKSDGFAGQNSATVVNR
jgi:hypothetical protein